MKSLSEMRPGESGSVLSIKNQGALKRRIIDMGFTPGAEVKMIKSAPMGDPIEINVRGYSLSIRKSDASQIVISLNEESYIENQGSVLEVKKSNVKFEKRK